MFDLHGKLAVVTGCRRGIGLAMAEALAGAGADIIGVSANLEATGSEVARRVEALGRSFTGARVDLRGSGGGRAVRGDARRRRPRRRHPGQQRRHDRPRPARSMHDDAHLGPRARDQPDRAVPARAGARPGHGRARRRKGDLHGFAAQLPGRDPRAELHRLEVGGRRPGEGTRERVGPARRQRQRASRPDTSRPTTPRRCATIPIAAARSSSGSPPGDGEPPPISPAPRCSSPRRHPTTCAARSSPSTVAGSRDERR